MSKNSIDLANAPIVEAVLDIDCDLPPSFDLGAIETPIRDAFRSKYPAFRTQFVEEHQFMSESDGTPKMTSRRGIQALQLLKRSGKQLVQIRVQGFSFNRLAPYSSLDKYLPEIERTWRSYVRLVQPVQIRHVRLRYINRILLPYAGGKIELDDYLKCGPRLPDEDELTFVGFLNQHSAVELATGNQVNIVLAAQSPPADGTLPVILDIAAFKDGSIEPSDWAKLRTTIQSLRQLKNLVFKNSLTDKCLNLFQR